MLNIKTKKLKGFSLAEVLISLVIIAVILLLTAPVITKRGSQKPDNKTGNAIFYFNKENKAASSNCFVTTTDSSGKTVVKDDDGACDSYEFTVPNDVHKIDLTLVAGGGGGGGAAGGTTYDLEFAAAGASSSSSFIAERVKGIKVNFMAGSGEAGSAAQTANRKSGNGGRSGVGVFNFDVPSFKFLKNNHLISFRGNHGTLANILQNEGNSTVQFKYITSIPSGVSSTSDVNSLAGIGLDILENSNRSGLIFASKAPTSASYLALFCNTKNSSGKSALLRWNNSSAKTEISTEGSGTLGYSYTSNSKAAGLSGQATQGSDNLQAVCGLSPDNYSLPVNGKSGLTMNSSTTVTSGFTLFGGDGGRLPNTIENYGTGGQGGSLVVHCRGSNVNKCTVPTSTSTSSTYVQTPSLPAAGGAYGKSTITFEHPAGVGGGGVGGAAIKLNDIDVIPGARYTVVIGKGGAGGAAGDTGKYSATVGSLSAQAGRNGEGGSSTALYDEAGNLVVMVIGGAGGFGGKVNSPTGTANAAPTAIANSKNPTLPDARRNYPMVVFPEANRTLITNNFDTSITSSLSNVDSNISIPSTLKALSIVPAYINKKSLPLYELNSNKSDVNAGTKITSYDDKSGGFSSFASAAPTSLTPTLDYANIKSGVTKDNTYNGFYFRYPIEDTAMSYSGGLGGFSGLGTKAGCGGLFVGNMDGVRVNGSATVVDDYLAGTFTIKNRDDKVAIYKTKDFYSGCTYLNSDGQTAEFINPSVSSSGVYFGQAGSGGGGGGWSSKYGSGKGGDGQNGYVLINWHN